MLVPLIYSLSTTAKRDIVGRKPRQKIFSRDGSCSVHDAGSWRSGGGDQVYVPLHIHTYVRTNYVDRIGIAVSG